MNINVNQVGYPSAGLKTAVAGGNFTDLTFELIGKNSGTVKALTPANIRHDENSGETTGLLDFSDVTKEDTYCIKASDGTCSPEFAIKAVPYEELLHDALKMFYFQRCGCELAEKYAGIFTHRACHTAKVKYLYDETGKEVDCTGGWHDAGDFGRYVTAGAVALGHLLYAYKLFPDKFDFEVNIPESGNGTPDILNECRYELEWFLKMQDEDGGVHHKCTSMHHTAFVMPEDDPLPFIITPVSSLATADFAAVTALASDIYGKFDKEFADRLAKAAKLSGEWLLNNPDYLFENPSEVTTGDYADNCDFDERLWAHAELYVLTKDSRYLSIFNELFGLTEEEAFLNNYKMTHNLSRYENGLPLTLIGWEDVGGLAALSIINAGDTVFNPVLVKKLTEVWLSDTERLSALAEGNNYLLAMNPGDFLWGSNLNVLNNAVIFAYAALLDNSDADKYRRLAYSQLDYILGKNALSISYVTGYGSNSFKNPHNRPTFADGIDEPIPGYVSGGPNRGRMDDAARQNIPEGTAPMKCFTDDYRSYSTNEITIYWNSPLVLLLAMLG